MENKVEKIVEEINKLSNSEMGILMKGLAEDFDWTMGQKEYNLNAQIQKLSDEQVRLVANEWFNINYLRYLLTKEVRELFDNHRGDSIKEFAEILNNVK